MFVSVLMTYPATIAIIAETFGQYLIEGLKQVYEIDDDWAPLAQKLFGFSLLLLVTWMNFFSLNKFAARFQIVATVAKLLSCFLIIVTGLYYYYVKGIFMVMNAAFGKLFRLQYFQDDVHIRLRLRGFVGEGAFFKAHFIDANRFRCQC
ncbi:hypothetical protein ANCCAN_23622 [Ancylostoma caninum]|uniref:Uncharacterized protein n=1 Tax=Ancylostoma caninum TaxID=29170 RepID=A0A368FEK0_ANCCA|nr:hypothetical protein ANCCAN_23622 [Ancylostoma caninum]